MPASRSSPAPQRVPASPQMLLFWKEHQCDWLLAGFHWLMAGCWHAAGWLAAGVRSGQSGGWRRLSL